MKRIICFVLVCLLFVGCSEDNSRQITMASEKQNLCSVLESDMQYSKMVAENQLGIDGESYINLCINDKYIALYGLRPNGETAGDLQVVDDCLTFIDRDTKEQDLFTFNFWEDVDPDESLVELDFWDDTTLMLLFSEVRNNEYVYEFWFFDRTTGIFSPYTALTTTRSLDDGVYDMCCVDQKVYVSFFYGDILCFDFQCSEEIVFFSGLTSPEFVQAENGALFIIGNDEALVKAVPVMGDGCSVGTPVSLIESTWHQVCDGSGVYDFYITYENQICGVNMSDQTMTIVFDGYTSGIDLNHVRFFAMGATLVVCDNVTEDFLVDEYVLYTLEQRPADEEQRTTLKLATLYTSSDLQEAIVAFNQENANYIIELEDYSQYGDNGRVKLYTDIMSGDIPDILNLSGLQETTVYQDEYLIDLMPYVCKKYGDDLEGIQKEVLQAQIVDDHLLTITPNFKLNLLCSLTPVDEVLTTDKFLDVLSQNSQKDMVSRDDVLEILLENTLSEIIDPVSNTIDEEMLAQILEETKQFPSVAKNDVDSITEGLYSGCISFAVASLSSFRSYRQLVLELGDTFYVYGYPGISRDAIVMEANNYLAITTSSQHPDAAWAFIETMLEPAFQKKYSHRTFPIVREVLDELISEAKETEVGFSDHAEERLDVLFLSVSLGKVDYESIFCIITEEAESYFSGDKDVNEVISIIQNRVHIYLAEQA